MLDIIIRNGKIVDGSGQQAYPADVKIENGRIAEISPKLEADAHEIVNADGCVIIIALISVASLADILAPYSYKKQKPSNMYLSPSRAHPMGTDEFGRDVLSRVIYGSRISVYVGVVSVGLSVVIGLLIGSIAAITAAG